MSKLSLNGRIKSFYHAFQGIKTAVLTQRNMWIHLFITLVVIVAGFVLNISAHHWMMLVLSIALVLFAEMVNTSFEFLCDALHPETHPLIKQAKDVAAGAVLVMAFGAALIGLIVFLPSIFGQIMHKKMSIILFLLVVLSGTLCAKKSDPFPFALNSGIDFMLFSAGVALSTSYMMQPSVLTQKQLDALNPADVSAFDRSAINQNHQWANPVADALLITSLVAPALLYADRKTRSGWFTYGVMYIESFLLTTGLNGAFKISTKRVRPYVYRTGESHKKSDRQSFYSGHTAHVWNSLIFSATTFTIMYPKSKMLPLVWIGAVGIGTTVGTMRYLSGDHFPTDIMMGAIMGILTGVSIPLLHHYFYKKKVMIMPVAVSGGAMLTVSIRLN